MFLEFRDDIQKALNRNEITMSVLIDYSKAFDTINHETLLKKLVNLNFSKSSIKIIMSYLANRHQYTQIDDAVSCRLPMYFGVPQGSILGPVLFNIYVANLPSTIKSDSIQYADDATVYKSCKKTHIIPTVRQLETDISSLCKWSSNNGLIFNRDKLKYMFSTKRGDQTTDKSFLIRSGEKSIPQESTVKLLGLIFDKHLTWSEQINQSAY
jgi:retron-type reverse transcriptase